MVISGKLPMLETSKTAFEVVVEIVDVAVVTGCTVPSSEKINIIRFNLSYHKHSESNTQPQAVNKKAPACQLTAPYPGQDQNQTCQKRNMDRTG